MLEGTFSDKMKMLEKIVEKGLEKLLIEVKAKQFLYPPYGKGTPPNPLITEEEFVRMGGLDGDDSDPPFVFDYGFNALSFLADYIEWSHPKSVENRRQEKLSAFNFLVTRARHAEFQLSITNELKCIANNQSSGILWGPFVNPISSTSVFCTCQSLRYGKVIIQLSNQENFETVLQTFEQITKIIKPSSQSDDSIPDENDLFINTPLESIAPIQLMIHNLKPCTQYYLRTSLLAGPTMTFQQELSNSRPSSSNSTKPMQSSEEDEDEDEEKDETVEANSKDNGIEAVNPYENQPFQGQSGPSFVMNQFLSLPEDEVLVDSPENLDTFSVMTSKSSLNGEGLRSPSQSISQQPTKNQSRDSQMNEDIIIFPPVTIVCVGQLLSPFPPQTSHPSTGRVESMNQEMNHFAVTCFLGDFLRDSFMKNEPLTRYLQDFYFHSPWFRRILKEQLPIMSRSNMIISWTDTSSHGDKLLQLEEHAVRKYKHESMKYQKKYAVPPSSTGTATGTMSQQIPPPPKHIQPPLSIPLETLLQLFPLDFYPSAGTTLDSMTPPSLLLSEGGRSCRMLYRAVMIGPDVQLIVLDNRGAYLGKEQTNWLTDTLERSTALWKIVLGGYSLSSFALRSPDGITETESFTAALADEIDELTGRPKHSLLTSLANVMYKQPLKSETAAGPSTGAGSGEESLDVEVTSGIIIVSNGLCQVVQKQVKSIVDHVGQDLDVSLHGSTNEAETAETMTEEFEYIQTTSTVPRPFYIAGYHTLATPDSMAGLNSLKKPSESIRSFACLEICLGLPSQGLDTKFDFQFQNDFLLDILSVPTNPETFSTDCITSKMSLLPDGRLEIKLLAPMDANNSKELPILAEITVSTPMPSTVTPPEDGEDNPTILNE